MISAIATIQDGSCRCVHFDFDESTSWDALKQRLSKVLDTPQPFTVSYLDDDGEDIAVTAAEWPTTSASAASSNNFLVLNVTPAEPPVPEAQEESKSESKSQRPQFGGRCGNGRAFGGAFPLGCDFSKVQEAFQKMGLGEGDVQNLIDNFLTGAPLPEEKVQGIARGLSSLTGRPEEAISEHVKNAYSRGQAFSGWCQQDGAAFASNARAYAASVAEAAAAAAAEAELASAEAERKERENAGEQARAARASALSRVRHPARCDVCKKGIVGVRMKCLNCEDYDMCEACEQRNPVEQLHPDGHVFAKIYKPSLLRFAEPFPNLYEAAASQRRAARASRQCASPNGPVRCGPARFNRGFFVVNPQGVGSQAQAAANTEDSSLAALLHQRVAEERQQKVMAAKREWMEKRKAAAQAAANSEDSRLASLEQKLLQLTQALAEEKAARERTTTA